MKTYQVGIVGATGMVGQRFATLLENHPWFHVKALAASGRSAGKTYEEAVGDRWAMSTPMPESMKNMVIFDATADVEKIASMVDFVFCAVNMKKDEIKALEEAYAKAECPVMSNNSANRGTPDVPMIIPEINADHAAVIDAQRKRLGTKRGFISVKSNCSLQSYVPAIHPLMDLNVTKVLAWHLPGHLRRWKNLQDLAGKPRQCHPLHRWRRGKVRAGTPQDLGPCGGRQDRKRHLPVHHLAVPARTGLRRPHRSGVCLL